MVRTSTQAFYAVPAVNPSQEEAMRYLRTYPYKRVTLPSCQLLLFTLEDQEEEQRGGGQVGADPGTAYTDRWGFSRSQGTTEWVSQKHIHTRLCLEVPESQGRAVGM